MVIAIDFDDTLMDRQNVLEGYRMGPPTNGAVLAVQQLAAAGHTVIIFTARRVSDARVHKAVSDWLEHFAIPHSGITNIKQPEFDVIIDNRGLRYENWPQTLSDLVKIENGHFVSTRNEPKLIKDITQPYL